MFLIVSNDQKFADGLLLKISARDQSVLFLSLVNVILKMWFLYLFFNLAFCESEPREIQVFLEKNVFISNAFHRLSQNNPAQC